MRGECLDTNGPIAQLDRVTDFYSVGCRFESCWDRHQNCNFLLSFIFGLTFVRGGDGFGAVAARAANRVSWATRRARPFARRGRLHVGSNAFRRHDDANLLPMLELYQRERKP